MFQSRCDVWFSTWLGQLSSCVGSTVAVGMYQQGGYMHGLSSHWAAGSASHTSLADLGHSMALSGRCCRASCSTGLGTGTALLPLPFGLPGCDTTAATCATRQQQSVPGQMLPHRACAQEPSAGPSSCCLLRRCLRTPTGMYAVPSMAMRCARVIRNLIEKRTSKLQESDFAAARSSSRTIAATCSHHHTVTGITADTW